MTLMATKQAQTGLPRGRALTREDMLAMPDDGHRYELIDGVLIVSPAPRIVHQRVSMRLIQLLSEVVLVPWELFHAPTDVVLADDTVMQPDLLVAAQADLTERELAAAPLLAVEILSPSTRSVDLLLKKERLERAGCQHYWVVDPDEPSMIAWTLVDGRYREVARAVGQASFEVTEPFGLSLTPALLVG